MKILELQNIEKIYGEKENQVKALRNINFQVEEGEFVAIVGTSGSGKSTLLNLIGGLDNPTRGKIFIKNKEIGSLSRKELTIFRRRNIGFVFQNYSLMPVLNVYDNVALPLTFDRGRHLNRKYVEELLRELGIWEKRNYTPPEGSVLRPAGGFLRKADDCPQRSGSCQSSQGKLHFPCAGCRQLPLCGLAARKHLALQAVPVQQVLSVELSLSTVI